MKYLGDYYGKSFCSLRLTFQEPKHNPFTLIIVMFRMNRNAKISAGRILMLDYIIKTHILI